MTKPVVLTPEQERIVDLRDGAFLVVAPPGSGKTEVLAQRVVRLLQESAGESFRILALTFTKKAAIAMQARVQARLGVESWRATIATYHSFCFDLLQHYGNAIGIPPEVTIYDTDDDRLQALVQGLIAEGYATAPEDLNRAALREILGEISRLKRELIPPSAAPTTEIEGIELRAAYGAYEDTLRRNGALDFDSVLARAYELLTEHPRVGRHYRRMYRYILIDEAQDTSRAQYEILKALCGDEHRDVFMVADPAQSIYGFRGASAKYLDLFLTDFRATRLEMGRNFRCSEAIVRAADRLLPRRSASAGRGGVSAVGAPGCIGAYSYETEAIEAAETINWIEQLLSRGLPRQCLAVDEPAEVRAEHVAILARNRLHLHHILQELDARQLDYHFSAGERGLFDSELYRVILYGVKVRANPRDLAIRRSLLAQLPETSSLDPPKADEIALLDVHDLLQELASRERDPFSAPLRILSEPTPNSAAIQYIMDRLTSWEPAASDVTEELAELWRSDREVLLDRWNAYRNRVESREHSWQGVLMELIDRPREDSPGIRVLTVHGAKGLEFHAVALVGMNDGAFPDFRSKALPDDFTGERRLAYVALTRAARVLRLSRPRVRRTRYGWREQEESPFMKEMGLVMEDR